MADLIRYEFDGGVARMTFDRPDRLNAFDRSMQARLLDLLERTAADDAVRVVLLTGRGRAFSAGVDLKELQDAPQPATDTEARAEVERLQEITRRIVDHPRVVIAALNGLAIGLGLEIAIASDIRVAADAATFTFTEVRRGLFHTNGVLHRLPRIVGEGRAADWLMTGDTVDAEAAHAAGLVTRLHPADDLERESLALARRVAANAPIPVRLVKEALRSTWQLDLEQVLQLEIDGTLECLASDDVAEGIRAFVEKREPVFRGR